MTNDRIHRSARRRKRTAMHAIFAALIMVSGSTAVVHAREALQFADLPAHQAHVAGADGVPPDENTLGKVIEEENARTDRLVRSICRGC